jgi:glycosyltransferase involved in cell wall biosynthesis
MTERDRSAARAGARARELFAPHSDSSMTRSDSSVPRSDSSAPHSDSSMTHSDSSAPRSVLMAVPRWTRDGGVSAHVQTSAAILARHGLDVRVLVARIESPDEVPGVTLYRCPDLFHNDVPMEARIGEALSFDPDLFHLHQVDLPDVAREMRARAPLVVSAHNYPACSAGGYYFGPGKDCTRAHGPGCILHMLAQGCGHRRNPKSLPTRYKNASTRTATLESADLVVSYSTAVDRHLAANGIAERRIVPYSATVAAKPADGHPGGRRVVFAGRLVQEKGVDVLIRAARSVDAEFIVCGDGRLLEPMRRLARRCGVEGRVSFKGWLSSEQLAEEFASAAVVVVPSLWPEPFGLVGIEALAAGRPVIASASGGVGDWLDDGLSGLCVEPGNAVALADALNVLLADPDRQRAMGIAGMKSVDARFSPERHLAAILNAYRDARSVWKAKA